MKYVKWQLDDGKWQTGTFQGFTDEDTEFAKVLNAETEAECSVSTDKLISITDGEFNMKEVELQAELTKAQASLATAEAKVKETETVAMQTKSEMEKMKTEKAAMEKDMEKAKADLAQAQAELAAVKQAALGEARFNELGAEASTAAFGAEAKAKLGQMDEPSYKAMKNLAQAMTTVRSTDVKPSDVSPVNKVTGAPTVRSTEADASVVIEAEAEKVDADVAVAAAASADVNQFKSVMAKALNRNGKKESVSV